MQKKKNVVSERSDRKKYNFVAGLQRDVEATRTVLRRLGPVSTFGEVFQEADGLIANLTRALQNLRRAGEITFEGKMLLKGRDDDIKIALTDLFYRENKFRVTNENCFRALGVFREIPQDQRRGRSYDEENLIYKEFCAVCGQRPEPGDRITIRDKAYHLHCLCCARCGANLRSKPSPGDYLTFDAKACCSSACTKAYDAAHTQQDRR